MNNDEDSTTSTSIQQVNMVISSPSGLDPGSEEEDDNYPSTSEDDEVYDENATYTTIPDDVTAQLAAAGPIGVAAAAAIASSKKRKRLHSFETNPSIRKRQQNRLLRKMKQTVEEFTTRVGQQAVVLVVTPGKTNAGYKVFGAKPLEDVVKNLKTTIMEELDNALLHQAPPPVQEDPNLFELPPLVIDGIPTPVEKMTQAQLRAFIPLMLKYSTGRGKPGWGRESTKPPWWPKELPWANVRMDARSDDDKQKISWTHALRQIVINCYKYHGREDLLPTFNEDEIININLTPETTAANTPADYTPTILHTITNSDGTVSVVHVDPNNPIITLPDGTTAQVQGVTALQTGHGEDGPLHAVQAINEDGTQMDLSSVTEATLNSDGQIILTGEDGQVSGVITVPVSGSMYQTLHTNSDGTICLTPIQMPKMEGNGSDSMEIGSGAVTHSVMIQGAGGGPHQVLQILSLKDAAVLNSMAAVSDVKTEEIIVNDL